MFSHAFILGFLDFVVPNLFLLPFLVTQLVLNISMLRKISRFSRRRSWSLEIIQRNSSKLLSRLCHKSLSQGTLRWDLYGCSSLVIPYHHTILILRGCHSPCHFSWWRQRYLRSHHRLYYRSSIWFSSRNGRQDYQLSAG